MEGLLNINALVYGHYKSENLGDELFIQAFEHIFPEITFNFTCRFTQQQVVDADIIIFGGGSFLYAPIKVDNDFIYDILKLKEIFYIGVGIETDIHSIHKQLMSRASLIASRSPNVEAKIRLYTDAPIMNMLDLVYSLSDISELLPIAKPNSILILPNAELLPRWDDINWKHTSFNYFKSEFSQSLDVLKNAGYNITFAPMSTGIHMHDGGAASEIINQMRCRNFNDQLYALPQNLAQLTKFISQYEIVISQRYHGAILAHMSARPCIVISHHDKLNNINDSCLTLSYYGLFKRILLDTINSAKKLQIMPIKLDTFEALRTYVYKILGDKCQNLLELKMGKSK